MKICYLDFWPGFDIKSNWFNLVFREFFNDIEIEFSNDATDADIIMASSFGQEKIKTKDLKSIKIFYTGENERPDLSWADYSMSFDFDTYGGKNLRLPHWLLYVNWWNEPNFSHAQISLDQLNRVWDPEEIWNREGFCSIMIGNPVPNRLEVAKLIDSNFGSVHAYGKVFGNPYHGDKVKLLENYKFNICFENSITDGYVTEKFLQAKVAGCIPIYYGHSSVSKDFNHMCAINYVDNEDMEAFMSQMYFFKDKDKFILKAKEPLFHVKPNLDFLYAFLKVVFNGKFTKN